MVGIGVSLLSSAAALASLQLFGLFKSPPAEMPQPAQITRVAVTPAMTAADCAMNASRLANARKYDALPIDKRASVKRQKSKDGAGIRVDARAKYYNNMLIEAVADAGMPLRINVVLKDAGPIPENYLILGNDAYRLPATYQTIPAPCMVPKGATMTYCTTPTVVRIALNREILQRMAASGSQQIRWVSRGGMGEDLRCNYLSADEATATLAALDRAG